MSDHRPYRVFVHIFAAAMVAREMGDKIVDAGVTKAMTDPEFWAAHNMDEEPTKLDVIAQVIEELEPLAHIESMQRVRRMFVARIPADERRPEWPEPWEFSQMDDLLLDDCGCPSCRARVAAARRLRDGESTPTKHTQFFASIEDMLNSLPPVPQTKRIPQA